ncbi:hypothetical protein jhhlp_003825 [Lomentospora prolificans]|uniref:DUF7704 domain-containing protein n=1 Tax=Lomentospora prolificans TaxID=41688 RepID=A0A2N3N9W8_9PEZI|nr:hypothetical protein jhhlp_003825 [Lomentospora prolificans]
MASALPPFPRVVFTILEPISLIGGFLGAVYSPDWFIAEQIPSAVQVPASDNSRLITLQLGNLYLLLCMVGVGVLSATTEIKVVRNYLCALWIADIGHIALTWYALGNGYFMDVSKWNAMTWGNIGATAFLFMTRTAYFLGIFGAGEAGSPLSKKLN